MMTRDPLINAAPFPPLLGRVTVQSGVGDNTLHESPIGVRSDSGGYFAVAPGLTMWVPSPGPAGSTEPVAAFGEVQG